MGETYEEMEDYEKSLKNRIENDEEYRTFLKDRIEERKKFAELMEDLIEEMYKRALGDLEGELDEADMKSLREATERALFDYSKRLEDEDYTRTFKFEEDLVLNEAAPKYDSYGNEDIFEVLDSITPKNYIIPNNKLINTLAGGEIYKYGETNVNLYKRKGKIISTIVRLNFDDDNIHIEEKDKRFTPYHRAVYNAICSIKEAGNKVFTPDQVYRCMNGYVESEYVGKVARKKVIETIEELREIKAWIDYTQEAKDRGIDSDEFIVDDYIVSAKRVRVRTGGELTDGYKLNSVPLLYEYASISRQIITIPITDLDTRSTLRYSDETLVIKNYIIRQIEWMKGKKGKDRNNNITFESINKELRLDNPSSYKIRKTRENTIKLLDDFKGRKIIKDYKITKKGRRFHGVEIFYK